MDSILFDIVSIAFIVLFISVIYIQYRRYRALAKKKKYSASLDPVGFLKDIREDIFFKRLVLRDKEFLNNILEKIFLLGYLEHYIGICRELNYSHKYITLYSSKALFVSIDIETIWFEERKQIRELGLFIVTDRGDEFSFYLNNFGEKEVYFLRRFFSYFPIATVIGHNIYRHDIPLLKKYGIGLSMHKIVDTLVLSVIVAPYYRKHTLEYLAEQTGIKYTPHNPVEDAKASFQLLINIISGIYSTELLKLLLNTDIKELSGLSSIVENNSILEKFKTASLTMQKKEVINTSGQGIMIVPGEFNTCIDTVWVPSKVSKDKLEKAVRILANGNNDVYTKLAYLTINELVSAGICDVDTVINKFYILKDIEPLYKGIEKLVHISAIKPVFRDKMVIPAKYINNIVKIFLKKELKQKEQ